MSMADELAKLQDLRARGTLTEDEYTRAKEAVLNSPPPFAHDPRIRVLLLFAQGGFLPHMVGAFVGLLLMTGLGNAIYFHLEHSGRGVNDDLAVLAIVSVALLGGVLGWLAVAGVRLVRKRAGEPSKD